MYGNKLAAAIKVNGKVLREFKDTVYIPFGAEYTILIKNLHTQRAVINIYIDGDNIVPNGLVLNAGQEVDLERSIKNNNLNEGNRFKFIERTENIENGPRGIKLEDGLIRIEHQFEIPRPVINVSNIFGSNYFPHYPPGVRSSEYNGVTDKFSLKSSGWEGTSATYSQVNVNGALRGVDYSKNGEAMFASATSAVNNYCAQNNISASVGEIHDGSATMDWCDTGITVPGSKSEQKFQETTTGTLESEKHSMIIRLLGDLGDNKPVTKPVTVKHKPKCVTCGKQNKANAKFCTECGTALEIFA